MCKRTIQKYMRPIRSPQPGGQNWATFLHNHAAHIWACDVLQVTDLFFRSLFAFLIIELKTRRVMHVGATRFPTDAWVAQQLREATLYGQAPKYLMCDHDCKFGSVRHECLDHLLILSEKQLQRMLNGYVAYFNRARPHQGLRQQLPDPPTSPASSPHPSDKIIGIPILGG